MMLMMQKNEFHHFVLQYILENLVQYDLLTEGEERIPLSEEDRVFFDIIKFMKRRSIENRIQMRWPQFEPRIKVYGADMVRQIMRMNVEEDTAVGRVRVSI